MFFSFIYQRPFTSLFLCFGLHEYLSLKYPMEYNDFRIQCGYYLVYYFSKVQLMYFKIHPHIVKGLEPFFQDKPFIEDVEFIKDGEVLYSCSYEEVNGLNSTTLPTDFDFMVYSQMDSEVKCINKKMFYSLPVTFHKIEKTDYHFMLTEVIIGNESIKIDLLTGCVNYFIVRNRIDEKFIFYYLKKFEPWVFDKYSLEEIQKYQLTIIDHSINVKELTKDSQIIFHKSSYEIIETKRLSHSTQDDDSIIDNKKISDSIVFTKEEDEDEDEDYTDLPDLIPMEEEKEDYTDLPDFIPMNSEEEKEDELPDFIPMNSEEEKEEKEYIKCMILK